jgi:hypothetical protein
MPSKPPFKSRIDILASKIQYSRWASCRNLFARAVESPKGHIGNTIVADYCPETASGTEPEAEVIRRFTSAYSWLMFRIFPWGLLAGLICIGGIVVD